MKLLITGAWDQGKESIPCIEEMGHTVIFMQQEKDMLPCPPSWAEGVICNGLFLYHSIETFSSLQYIQLTSVGFDRMPMAYIQEHGIEIHNAGDVFSIPMAEHAVACALWFYRGLGLFCKNQRAHLWKKQRNLLELNGKTVLIIGFGNAGKACAARFSALGCHIIYVNKRSDSAEGSSNQWVAMELHDGLKEADIIVVAVPLTDKTRGMINDDSLKQMKDNALLINISRGEIIKTDALLKHLPRMIGAALDVFEEEPLPADSPLWDYENVLITPHNSFVGDGNENRLRSIILEKLKQIK